ncbi:CWC16 protein [Xylaria grammica]|nr:CWC16 protein [Xylaria grammica]
MQGFNMGRYVPPDVEGTISGNALNKKHALGARASKLRTEGILTVRFEMPFGVWCGSCAQPTLIGQGVRFNAEKKKVGAYHSTPIWSFRMRHGACGGTIEIRTDPANAEYVVAEGGTRRDTGDGKDDDSLVPSSALVGGLGEILTGKEKDALRHDAFARLEKTIEDRGVLIERSHRIAELADASHRAWDDPYSQNRRLRAAFRTGRAAREKEAASTEDLQERMSLGIDLVPATEEDARRAALVDFGIAQGESSIDGAKNAALVKPLFAVAGSSTADGGSTPNAKREEEQKAGKKRLKSELKASRTRDSLASALTRSTRTRHDPFLLPFSDSRGGDGTAAKAGSRIQGIKRKQPDPHPHPYSTTPTPTPTSTPIPIPALTEPSTSTPNKRSKDEKGVRRVEQQGEGGEGGEKEREGEGERENPTPDKPGIDHTPNTNAGDERGPGPGPSQTALALVEYDSD